jgi:hypothetical protein
MLCQKSALAHALEHNRRVYDELSLHKALSLDSRGAVYHMQCINSIADGPLWMRIQ